MQSLELMDSALRIGLALGIGLGLGYERERHGRAAGMRTTMLVCVSAAVAMLLSEALYSESALAGGGWRPDPARLAAGVLAGMGFLGAGVILRQDTTILGVTTAAVLWLAAILGMAVGAGHWGLGLGGFAVSVLGLTLLPSAEANVQADRYATLEVVASLSGPAPEEVARKVAELGLGASAKLAKLEADKASKSAKMRFDIKVKRANYGACQRQSVRVALGMKGVSRVTWN